MASERYARKALVRVGHDLMIDLTVPLFMRRGYLLKPRVFA